VGNFWSTPYPYLNQPRHEGTSATENKVSEEEKFLSGCGV